MGGDAELCLHPTSSTDTSESPWEGYIASLCLSFPTCKWKCCAPESQSC